MKKRLHAIWVVPYRVFPYQHSYDKIQKTILKISQHENPQ